MWCQLQVGNSLELQCPRHPLTPIVVSQPHDFRRKTPEGGCTLRCDLRLPCGHQCPKKCHSQVVVCHKSCVRLKPGYDHACRKPCDPKCMEILAGRSLVLPWGHIEGNLKCWMDTYDCPVPVQRKVPGCGHTVTVRCHVDVNVASLESVLTCTAVSVLLGEMEKFSAIAQTLVSGCDHACRKKCYVPLSLDSRC
eukprot:Protomagalhaensia_wolfi_Nauph_80__3891@NODE_3943_length_675_cov_4_457547_g3124_i0_p1_GENE_NODE_3943_length_675_cov_4_457547_g3124_i0NODE_3943_length_675_cov_4_457547_g3124_i0_p1_ORF_typecomplete_len194_score3_47_NODE_3943_length_675_cov_4_457547_g3124_i092673